MAQNNLDKLKSMIGTDHKDFIVYDVETTGVMNGNDNRITQVGLAAYTYNKDKRQYELQDQIFMLARPDEAVLYAIRKNQEITDENIYRRVKEEYLYSLYKSKNSKYTKDEVRSDPDKFLAMPEYKEYCDKSRDKMEAQMKTEPTLEDTLSSQGIDLYNYVHEGKGLSDAQMQAGITEFLNRYAKNRDVVFINNGTYYTRHYMEKEGLTLGNNADNTIDLTQAERSLKGGDGAWTANFTTFAKNYKADTGKEIKIFDALTKSLCMGEMTTSAVAIPLELNSKKYLENAVKTAAFEQDDAYVMSIARLNQMSWAIAEDTTIGDYYFSSLEYVDFGNDRRYVDLDKMFEVNDNFEITLEGEKTPIKTWEELEAKIKALNAEISPELLENIHEKYEELYADAMEKKAEQAKKYAIPEEEFAFERDEVSREEQHLEMEQDLDYAEDEYEEDYLEDDADYEEDYTDFRDNNGISASLYNHIDEILDVDTNETVYLLCSDDSQLPDISLTHNMEFNKSEYFPSERARVMDLTDMEQLKTFVAGNCPYTKLLSTKEHPDHILVGDPHGWALNKNFQFGKTEAFGIDMSMETVQRVATKTQTESKLDMKIAEIEELMKKRDEIKASKKTNATRIEEKITKYEKLLEKKLTDLTQKVKSLIGDDTLNVRFLHRTRDIKGADEVFNFDVKLDCTDDAVARNTLKECGSILDNVRCGFSSFDDRTTFSKMSHDVTTAKAMAILLKNWDEKIVLTAYDEILSKTKNELREYDGVSLETQELDALDDFDQELE